MRRQAVPGEQRGELQRQTLVTQKPGGKVDGDFKLRSALVDLSGSGDGLFENEVCQLSNPVVLFGGSDEFGRGNRSLLGVGPASKGLGSKDLPRRKVELWLIGDPDLVTIDGFIELAQHRELP